MTKPPSGNRGRHVAKVSSPRPDAGHIRQYDATNRVIDFNERVYPAHKLAALIDTLGNTNVKATALLSDTELTVSQLRSASARVSYGQMVTVFRNALQLSPDPSFALRAGQRMHVTSYGMYGYALMSSPSHEAALEFAVKYHPVMGPVAAMSLTLGGAEAMFVYEPILSANPRDDLYRSCVEFVFASHLTLNKNLYGPSFKFARIGVVYARPKHADAYRKIFGCPVDFGHSRNEIRFDSSWLQEPVLLSDPITNAQAQELCDQIFTGLERMRGIASQIHRLLVERPGWFPRIETMAAQLSMTPRMLHRRLEAEQTTYRKLVGEVRMSLAIEYLRKTRMTNEDVAARLGYSDAANFRHAFARWTGKCPSDYRP